jgi:hypothetical protein
MFPETIPEKTVSENFLKTAGKTNTDINFIKKP